MSHSTKWRLGISLVALVWALCQSYPLQDRPFKDYLNKQASAQKEDFHKLVDRAQGLVASDQEKSLFSALLKLAAEEKIDLCTFFPRIRLADVKNLDKRNHILLQHLFQCSQSVFRQGLDLKGGVAFSLEINPKVLVGKETWERQQLVQKAIDVISGRIDSLGVAEPVIRPSGDHMIEVQLPGISLASNPDVVQALKKPAKLEFKLVQDHINPQGKIPFEDEVLYLDQEDENGNEQQVPLVVKRLPEMTGQSVQAAHPVIDPYGRYEISLHMTDAGKDRFAKITRNNIHRRLAIVLDGKVYSAPVIQTEIANGQASISGRFTQREAIELSNVLNNPLEFELDLMEVYEVGPSLAKDAKASAVQAVLVGIFLIMALMIYYYKGLGFLGSVALLLNGLLVMGAWAGLRATITLPSITALALTFGMAVDANILIFERMREEMKNGADSVIALRFGYDKAFATILDANLTTLLTAGLLIWLGVGSVKGFGITLAIGILTTLFSVLVFNHGLAEIWVRKWGQNLQFKTWLSGTDFDFLKYRQIAISISAFIFVLGLIAMGVRGRKILGIDFLGGDTLLVQCENVVKAQDVRYVADREHCGEVGIVEQHSKDSARKIFKIQTEKDKGTLVLNVLNKQFPQAHFQLLQQNTIGASVSSHMQKNAFWSVVAALLGILCYVALRFEFGYGLGAVLGLLHDIFIVVGLYISLGHQFSAPMIAAVLMVIGYSINDTIIIFDRIREELTSNPSLTLKQVINLAINKTLSRTIMTSITTLIPAVILFLTCSGIVNDYALIFLLGVLVGTFSSIFIASPILYAWYHGDRRRLEHRDEATQFPSWMQAD